jgi:hypothetical protein
VLELNLNILKIQRHKTPKTYLRSIENFIWLLLEKIKPSNIHMNKFHYWIVGQEQILHPSTMTF